MVVVEFLEIAVFTTNFFYSPLLPLPRLKIIRDVQVCLVQRHGAEIGIILPEDRSDLFSISAVFGEVEGHEHEVWTEFAADEAGHAGANAELAGVVVGGTEDIT